ncbi:Transglutaminase-like protein [Lasiodiplodia theobromae]|nr:Transglutaminase-like protein [Lasiodiplodia theobromae]
MTLPGGKKTQELWSVKLDGIVSEGDCGSIVVNEETGNLEGHIVAGSPGSGNAYIIPAHGVLQDIRRRLSSRLQIWNRFSRCTPRVPTTAISGSEASALTRTFRENLSEARKAKLTKARRTSPLSPLKSQPPIIHNIPITPQQPQSQKSIRFKDLLWSLSSRPFQWNNPDLLDEALSQLPLEILHRQAEKEFEVVHADAKAHSPARRPILGFEDCVIKALLRWFKRSFFQWVDNPTCSICRSKTTGIGMAVPQAEELAGGARAVEAYRCENRYCGNFERFPRYNDPFVLMRTRRGRSGEWTQCFSMLCHALGARVRLVWNAEDHVWTEVYSKHQKRWIHVDAHAEAWDEPRIYCEGWGKRLSYCIAFSKDGATDVTRRYVRGQRFALERKRASEAELIHILGEIRSAKQKDMSAEQQQRLMLEDRAEQAELQKFIWDQIMQDLCKLDVGKAGSTRTNQPDPDGERTNAMKRWRLSDNVVIG